MSTESKKLVMQMTLEEKAGLCSGKDTWRLKEVARLGVESIMMSDGPHGLRKQMNESDNLGLSQSIPSVCFPTASALACSFDRELLYEVGEAIAQEALEEKVSVVLGPGVNIKRSPLCGRNFEYFSEDPLVAGELAAAMINGIQSKDIGASLKHFALNNQEKRRMTVSVLVDDRAFREIYLKPFEIAIKKSKPWTVMCAYNKIDGTYCSENSILLTGILRDEWGFDGLVISDWGAVNQRILGVEAGNDLEMPGSNGINDKKIIEAVKSGDLSVEYLDKAVENVVDLILKSRKALLVDYKCDFEKNHQKAIKASEESAVLLKNEGNILPGNISQNAAVIGEMAKTPRYQGTGSSKINPVKIDNAWDALMEMGLKADYADGSDLIEAIEISKGKDIVYLFIGMTDEYESEGFDRDDLLMPKEHVELIEEISKVNENIVVILSGGAPMEITWKDKAKAILLMYLGGEGVGSATANLILGVKSPSGKLAETWPLKLEDTPSYNYFPGGRVSVEYRESIFVGYRYYDTVKKEVLFPFGYGLSYSEFKYSELKASKKKITVKVKNIGKVEAKETVLLFVSNKNEKVNMPEKQLKAFEKISLEPGESKKVVFEMKDIDLSYYNTEILDWYTNPGEYLIRINGLETKINVESEEQPQPNYNLNPSSEVSKEEFEKLLNKELPDSNARAKRPFTVENNFEDAQYTLTGKIILKVLRKEILKIAEEDEATKNMMYSGMKEMPLHVIMTSYSDMIKPAQIEGILQILNRHYIRGIKKLLE